MSLLIIIFGALTALAGILIVAEPKLIFGLLEKHSDKFSLHVLAVVVRVLLGALLIYYAAASRYPLVIEIIGWISIVAAVVLAAIGRANFKRLMSWALTQARPIARLGGVVAVIFGAFLVYAFV